MVNVIKQNVQLKQKQTITLSSQLQQSLKILQLSKLDLIETIQSELLENPSLEEEGSPVPLDTPVTKTTTNTPIEDIDWERISENQKPLYQQSNVLFEERPGIENLPEKQSCLRDFLYQQLRMLQLAENEKTIAELIIDGIDERGYLSIPLEIISDSTGASLSAVEDILFKIQEFEPPGVAARDIKECFMLQIKDLELQEPLLEELLNNYFLQLQHQEYDLLSKKLNVTIIEIKRLVSLLLMLEPIPIRLYEKLETQYIIPDIIAEISREGEIKVEVNNDWVPQIKINPYYQSLLKQEDLPDEEKEFVRKRIKDGLSFIKALEDRKSSLQRVSDSIFEKQKDFFVKGIKGLVPMRLEDIATELNYHTATISRTISNKYVKTSYGIFPLKFFFVGGMSNQDGNTISSVSIKERIKEMIDKEDCRKPLSDDKIAKILNEEGFDITRRTVANYRESLGLLPSTHRRNRKCFH